MKSDVIVIVTRAGESGARLAKQINALGLPAIHSAPIELAGPADPDECANRLSSLLPVDRIIITSPEGVRRVAGLMSVERFGDTPIMTPGPGTAALARQLGIRNPVCPVVSGDSEAMLELPELASVAGLRILILAAAGGRRLLETTLRERGAKVDRLHVYQRIEQQLPESLAHDLGQAGQVLTLISSGGALSGLRSGLSPAAWQKVLAGTMVAPSRRVADMARQAGAQRVVCARGADDQAMLDALQMVTKPDQIG